MLSLLFSLWAVASDGALDGRWTQPCRTGYQREELFAGERVTYSEKNFLDVLCQKPGLEIRSEGTWVDQGHVLKPLGGRAMDFTFERVSVTVSSDTYVSFYNQISLCGFSDWSVGTTRDITGLECDFFNNGRPMKVPARGNQRFGIYKLERGELWFGQQTPAFDGTHSAKRPRDWEVTPYRRFEGN